MYEFWLEYVVVIMFKKHCEDNSYFLQHTTYFVKKVNRLITLKILLS
jgi:hypothetical protein